MISHPLPATRGCHPPPETAASTFAPLHRPQADLHFCTTCPHPFPCTFILHFASQANYPLAAPPRLPLSAHLRFPPSALDSSYAQARQE